MQVLLPVGVSMMISMMGRPPERALLHCGAADPCQDELEPPIRPVRPVGEVTMVPSRNSEHADHIEAKTDQECPPAHGRPECGQRGDVNAKEGEALRPIDPIAAIASL